MIPKRIHYCWFGRGEMSPFIKQCIATWRKVMPDYELKLWNEDSFDVNSVPFVKEAYESKKYAFVSDYVRLYALYTEGGVYLDTDVTVYKPFDEFLHHSFFACHEYMRSLEDLKKYSMDDEVEGVALQSGAFGAEAGIQYLKDCLDHYNTMTFDKDRVFDYIITLIIAKKLVKYGYKFNLKRQALEPYNITIYEPSVFATISTFNDQSYALHLFNGSWGDNTKTFKYKFRNRFPKLSWIIQKIYRRIRY